MDRVVVLGAGGMLGSMVLELLARDPALEVAATVRSAAQARRLAARVGRGRFSLLEATRIDGLTAAVRGARWVVNAIGITKPHIDEADPGSIERAIRVNGVFPYELAAAAEREGARVLQIATDCVFSGRQGAYAEDAVHDPLDVYGMTKSLGEVRGPAVHHLRCSIVGPEREGRAFLLEWVKRQPPGATLQGFVDQRWNGVTTLQFARLCQGIVRRDLALPPLVHVVPGDALTKRDLLEAIAAAFGRGDLAVTPVETGRSVDRTLSTLDPARNRALWEAAGYPEPPDVRSMLEELAAHERRRAPVRAAP